MPPPPRCLPVPPLSGMCRRCLDWIPTPFRSFDIFDAKQKVSELSVKCVFGLHRRERIAYATFQKRLQKVILKKWYFWLFFGTFPTWAQEGQTGERRLPKGFPRGFHWEFKVAKWVFQNGKDAQRLSQTCHKRGFWLAKMGQKRRKIQNYRILD